MPRNAHAPRRNPHRQLLPLAQAAIALSLLTPWLGAMNQANAQVRNASAAPTLRWTGGMAMADGNAWSPYVGAQWHWQTTPGVVGAGWRLGADLGLNLQPRSPLRLGTTASEAPLDDILRDLRLAPVLTFGASYSF